MVGAVQAAVIILAIVAALLAVGLVAVAWSRRATRRRLTATDAKLTATEETLEATRSTLTETEIEAGRATTRAEAETTRADDAERDATEARDELERVRASGGDASVLGGLEAVRITRLWRDVAGAADPPPVATDDEVEAALNVLAVVSREASGTTVAVDWKRTTPVPPAAALLVVRIAEELIASVKHADRATLEVGEATTPTEGEGEGGTAVTVRILSDPATPLPEGLAEVLGSTGWVTSSDPGEVEVRLPA
jgi:membrane protein implicated in regulation of membrane protease activity